MILGEPVDWPKYAIDTARNAFVRRGENIMTEPAFRIALDVPQSSRSLGANASMKRSINTSSTGISVIRWRIGNSCRHGSRRTGKLVRSINSHRMIRCTLFLYFDQLISLILEITVVFFSRFVFTVKGFVTHYIR